MSKPREWEIECLPEKPSWIFGEYTERTKVIEYSAHQALQQKLEIAKVALEFYAAYPGNKFKTVWNEDHVCDSWSGAVPTFDYDGSLADTCDEVARKALKEIEG